MSLKIILDGSSEYPVNEARKKGLLLVPVFVFIDGKEYKDPGDVVIEDVYTRLREDPEFYPTTSQPSPSMFYEAYEQAINEGATDILVITVSKALSGTFNSAWLATQEIEEEYEGIKFYLLDSKSTASAMIFLADYALRLNEQGKTPEEIYELLLQERDNIKTIAYLTTLKYLYRSGRISRAKYYLGSLLHFRIILEFTSEGKIEAFGRYRNHEQGLKQIVDLATNHGKARVKRIAIHHGNASEDAEKLKEFTLRYYPRLQVEIKMLRFSLLAHGGPKTMGYIVQYEKESLDSNQES